jgi:ricin-type beta-trefoil lectin protein
MRLISPRRLALLAGLVVGAAAVPASANAAIAPGNYKISTGGSAFTKVLDVQGGSTAPGARVIQFTPLGGSNQKWNVIQTGSTAGGTPAYSLRPLNNLSLCMDIQGGSTAVGAGAITFNCHFGTNQQFFISKQSGEFRIVPRHSGLTMTMPSFLNSAQLIQRLGPIPPNGLPTSQQFHFTKL